ncbi:uncharacterized protein LOC131618991 [Vicia villosa]|uniref:uncharacterized protein LOC131618991 n=1 Tax=Vicia villosa TaxID=3911 RepID=UPI00273B18D1|nr:uncharacterized protein LOC131618991 [Vicia villosa]
MDQLRDDLIQMRTQVTAQMAQFMEVMQNMADRQEELRIRMDTVAQVVADPPQRNPADIRVNGESVIGGPGVIPPAANQGNPYGPPQPIPEGQATQQIRRAAAIPVLEEDRHEDLFPESELGFPHDAGRLFRGLEERMRAMEGQGLGMDINDLGLVPGVRVPPKFKVPDFEKYKGNTCPKTHVRAYYRKMHVYSEDEGLLMHFFQDSLTGASLEWYMRLERTHIRSWRDLVDAFIKQYQYNVDMAPNRTQLQNLSQKANESFKEYAQKWRELAARVQPPMLEREMMDLFTNTLEGQYYSACSASSSFAELVMIGERIESGIKAGRIQNPSAASSSSGAGGKKPYNGFAKKREGETSAAYYGSGRNQAHQQVAAVTIPNAPFQHQQQGYQPRQYQQRPKLPERAFDPIPMTYAQVLPYLLDLNLVQLRTLATPAKLPPNWDANARCEFHSGSPGHNIENCKALKHKVQDLLDSKAIEFTPTQGPNVVQNPMPPHGTHAANAIGVVEDTHLVKDVIELGSLLPLLKKELLRMRLYAGCGEFCPNCMVTSSVCDKVKDGIQQLIDSGYLQFERVRRPEMVENAVNVASIPYTPAKIPIPARAPPLVITSPGPVPYTSEKAIPWNYGGEVFYQGAKYEVKAPVEKEDVDNVVGIGRMTRSGRIFNPPQNTRDDNAEALAQAKGKRVVEDTVDPGQSSNSEDTVAKEMEEFLKIIKKSEYKVVDQLSQTQSKISILQLLLCSETHRNALLRLLGTAFVPPEISVNQLEGVVSNINAGNGLGFTDADLPSEGRKHNRALHISVECKGTMLSRVLVDNGSSLNVLPKSSLMRLDYSGVEIRPSELTVRAFDGSKRSVFGEVDLPVMIGPQLFTITFFVMDIHPAYSCLLGRPWIHAAGAVTSTLHQKLKFATQGKIVTICGEEEHVVSHLASFKYIDMEGEVHETPCQAFEAVQTIKIPYVEKKKLEAPMSSLKEAKAVVESGHPEGWGRVLDLPIKQDKCGIGYQLGQSSSDGSFKKPGTFVPIKFSSAGIVKDHICAADDDMDSDYDIEEWIKPCVPGQKLLNWSSEDIISIALDQKSTSPPDSIDNDLAMPRYDFDNPIYAAEEGDEEDCELPDELARLLKQEEKVIEPHQEPIETVNLGTEETRREVKIGASLNENVKEKLVGMLKEYSDIFAWSYEDMPGLDTDIVVHRLPLKENSPPVKQKLRRTRPDMSKKIQEEVQKQFDAGFLAVTVYPPWVANIVPVPKKDGKVRMCVDYRDLNRASPKDDFPLPHIDVLVDNTAQFSVFSFMDGFSGYNQIKMAPEDMEKTTFITPWGTFCYKVMPFGLKNAGATYQRAMVTLFHDMIHKEIEVYVDDMIAKSHTEEEHLVHLKKLFERLRKFRLRLNPNKCTFGVRSGKLLGFIVSEKGIEVDPAKVKAIQEMPEPRTEKQVRGFLGRLNYIARFISHLTATCEPIFKLLRKNQAIKWDDDCQKAFDKVKEYLQEPPILMPPVEGRPLIMYLTVLENSMGCVLGQHDESGRKEHAIYYLSKKFTDCESRYSLLEKTCCALAWAARRLRQYMLTHTTLLISKMDPIKYIFEKPALTGRIARWQMILTEYDIQYTTQKAIKSSVIADYLAHQPVDDYQSMYFEFPDEDIMCVAETSKGQDQEEGPEPGARWTLVFDGASNALGNGIGAVLTSPTGFHIPFTARICFDCTNNVAEYEACIYGIEAAIDLRIKNLAVYGDSALVISQINGDWETRHPNLIPYREHVVKLAQYFDEITFDHIPREENHLADALATLASMFKVKWDNEAPSIVIKRLDEPAFCGVIDNVPDEKPWFYDIKKFLETQEYPEGASLTDRKTLKRLSAKFFIAGGVLYKRNFDSVLLRCVDRHEAAKIMQEVHEGSFGTHASGHTMARKILRAGYYWSTLEHDCFNHVVVCYKCQVYADRVHVPPVPLNVLTSPWPFAMWGIDMIGEIKPTASNGHRFILVAIDYFTKWVEAASYANVSKQVVTRFIKHHIICRYGVPERIITDNGSNLNNKMMKELCENFKITHHNSSPYRPKMNGAVEAANKNIKKIVQKMVVTYKDWHEMLPFALHGYRTSVRTSTGATPFSLVYGMEAILPVEVEIPSLRVLTDVKLSEADWVQTRFDQLNLIDEKRLAAICHGQAYQKKMKRAFDKKIRPRHFQVGDLVLKKILPIHNDPRGKWTPNYEGPYVVKKVFSGGAMILSTMDGEDFPLPVNADAVKKYFA